MHSFTLSLSQQPSEIGGCLDANVQLVYIIEFNNSIFKNNVTMDTSYLLVDVPQRTALEITITPKIPVLGLNGPPTSTNITIGKLVLQYNLTQYTYSVTFKHIIMHKCIKDPKMVGAEYTGVFWDVYTLLQNLKFEVSMSPLANPYGCCAND